MSTIQDLRRIGSKLPIPTYDMLMLPVLRLCASQAWAMRDLIAQMGLTLNLSAEELAQEIPSRGTKLLANRVHWAKTYLKKAGLLEQPRRGFVEISDVGKQVLACNPERIDIALLERFDGFRAFLGAAKPSVGPTSVNPGSAQDMQEALSTPEEQIFAASMKLDDTLRDALLARVLECSPAFFEKMIVDLLLAMGYGGSRADAGQRIGGTGDGGVDGVISEDQLGLDRIYMQAKRYQPGNSVGSDAVQGFVGALVGKGAQKGVLITTSTFTKAAMTVSTQLGSLRLVLIDGEALTKLMMRFNVGVRVAQAVEIKRIDLDFFEDGENE